MNNEQNLYQKCDIKLKNIFSQMYVKKVKQLFFSKLIKMNLEYYFRHCIMKLNAVIFNLGKFLASNHNSSQYS